MQFRSCTDVRLCFCLEPFDDPQGLTCLQALKVWYLLSPHEQRAPLYSDLAWLPSVLQPGNSFSSGLRACPDAPPSAMECHHALQRCLHFHLAKPHSAGACICHKRAPSYRNLLLGSFSCIQLPAEWVIVMEVFVTHILILQPSHPVSLPMPLFDSAGSWQQRAQGHADAMA